MLIWFNIAFNDIFLISRRYINETNYCDSTQKIPVDALKTQSNYQLTADRAIPHGTQIVNVKRLQESKWCILNDFWYAATWF